MDAVQDAYPEATMLRRRQVTTETDRSRPTSALLDDLTDRQRTTLEAAYHAGFFNWPRDASGEDVADSLQVSPPTFHQHLRKAEQKVFAGFFGSVSG
jgi:predicted DNA binding protein